MKRETNAEGTVGTGAGKLGPRVASFKRPRRAGGASVQLFPSDEAIPREVVHQDIHEWLEMLNNTGRACVQAKYPGLPDLSRDPPAGLYVRLPAPDQHDNTSSSSSCVEQQQQQPGDLPRPDASCFTTPRLVVAASTASSCPAMPSQEDEGAL